MRLAGAHGPRGARALCRGRPVRRVPAADAARAAGAARRGARTPAQRARRGQVLRSGRATGRRATTSTTARTWIDSISCCASGARRASHGNWSACLRHERCSGIPVEFVLFAVTLLGVAVLHSRALEVAATGLAAVIELTSSRRGVSTAWPGWRGSWRTSATSGRCSPTCACCCWASHCCGGTSRRATCRGRLPDLLPDDWRGAFLLLVLVFVLSSFLDNIAAALIGGTVAKSVFRGRVHVGYIAAIGGGVECRRLGQRDRRHDHDHDVDRRRQPAGRRCTPTWRPAWRWSCAASRRRCSSSAFRRSWRRTPARRRWTGPAWRSSALILAAAIAANVLGNLRFAEYTHQVPFIGLAIWVAIAAHGQLASPGLAGAA